MFCQSGIQNELNLFFKKISGSDFQTKVVDKSALTHSRKKISSKAYLNINSTLVEGFYNHCDIKRWNGLRILSIDGSVLNLPKSTELHKYFGNWKGRCGESAPRGRLSVLYDSMNDMIVDCKLTPKSVDEKKLMIEHIKCSSKGDLIVLDRGYQAFWVFKKLIKNGAHFCARLSDKLWSKQVAEFMESDKQEQVITLIPPANSAKALSQYRVDDAPIKLKLVKYLLNTGEVELLCTSLLDDNISANEWGKLYHKRWRIEENYKVLKNRLKMQKFMGKSVKSVLQEFYAQIFMLNLSLIIRRQANKIVKAKTKKRNYSCRCNFRQLLTKVRDSGILLFFRSNLYEMLENLILEASLEVTEIRPNRSNPRNHRVGKIESQSYPSIS